MDVDDEQLDASSKHSLGGEEDRPAKRSHVADTRASTLGEVVARPPAFGSSAARTTSYQEQAAVAPELRSRLESIGMRTRFNVARGYGSPPPSQAMTGPGEASFLSANDVLRSVRSTRSAWSRTQSELQPFAGAGDENAAPMQSIGIQQGIDGGIGLGDLKRGHDAFLEDWDETGSAMPAATSTSPRGISSPTRRRNGPMMSSVTMPAGSGLEQYLARAQPMQADTMTTSADEPWRKHDFTAFATGDVEF